jgi:hypothetical protein
MPICTVHCAEAFDTLCIIRYISQAFADFQIYQGVGWRSLNELRNILLTRWHQLHSYIIGSSQIFRDSATPALLEMF